MKRDVSQRNISTRAGVQILVEQSLPFKVSYCRVTGFVPSSYSYVQYDVGNIVCACHKTDNVLGCERSACISGRGMAKRRECDQILGRTAHYIPISPINHLDPTCHEPKPCMLSFFLIPEFDALFRPNRCHTYCDVDDPLKPMPRSFTIEILDQTCCSALDGWIYHAS